jgi:hypothetical protein
MNRKSFLAALGIIAATPLIPNAHGALLFDLKKLEEQKERIKNRKQPPYRNGDIVLHMVNNPTVGDIFYVVSVTGTHAKLKPVETKEDFQRRKRRNPDRNWCMPEQQPVFIEIEHGNPKFISMYSTPGERTL